MLSTYSRDPLRSSIPVCPSAPTSVPDLREIAAVNIAVAFWNHINIPLTLFERTGSGNYYSGDIYNVNLTQKVRGLIDSISVPNSVAEYIKSIVDRQRYRIDDWVTYHHRTIFFSNGQDKHLYYHVRHFAWYSDGTINHEQTARNLLSSLRLSHLEKYKFLCMYCLKDEIEEIMPLLMLDDVKEYVHFASHPLIYYWNCYYRNELDKIPVTGNVSLDSYMLQYSVVDNWPAKRYFFDRLNPDERVENAIKLIDKHGVLYLRLLFMKLNYSERIRVYMDRGVKIITSYCTEELNQFIIPAWFDVRFLITVEQFQNMFSTLLVSLQRLQNRVVYPILTEIWITANDDFKKHIVDFNDFEIIGKIFELQMKNTDNNELLFTMLSDINADGKKMIINRKFFDVYCDKLFADDKLQVFDRLLKVCIQDNQELTRFRQDLVFRSTYVGNECLKWYSNGWVDIVNKSLSKLLPTYSVAVLMEYKRNLMLSSEGIVRCVQNGILNLEKDVLNAVMIDSLLHEELITEFKRNLVISPSAVKTFQSRILNDQLTEVIYFVDNYLSFDEDRKRLKERLVAFDSFGTTIVRIFTDHDETWMGNLLTWCLENDKKILEYKSGLPVNAIFNLLLQQVFFCRYNYLLSNCVFKKAWSFEATERFLNWYFETRDKVKEYKLQRIYSFDEVDVIQTLLRKKDDFYLRAAMAWFFENDDAEKQKFRAKHRGKISYVLF
ncbi:uncharacterized protein LOC135849056 [Planococcus citri]|uniref:uncharacterized protein LOC135849056 n=1 Tax=Planococcus citri TaxID=170843 RepID=UPI0031F9AD7C